MFGFPSFCYIFFSRMVSQYNNEMSVGYTEYVIILFDVWCEGGIGVLFIKNS